MLRNEAAQRLSDLAAMEGLLHHRRRVHLARGNEPVRVHADRVGAPRGQVRRVLHERVGEPELQVQRLVIVEPLLQRAPGGGGGHPGRVRDVVLLRIEPFRLGLVHRLDQGLGLRRGLPAGDPHGLEPVPLVEGVARCRLRRFRRSYSAGFEPVHVRPCRHTTGPDRSGWWAAGASGFSSRTGLRPQAALAPRTAARANGRRRGAME